MGARVSVPTSLNPAGMDLGRWKELGYPEDFAKKQLEIIELYGKLGIDLTCSCIPYETPHRMEPIEMGDHLSWGESNAVIYANSMVGARTNREGGISALASAILGKTPNWGMHREENRYPTIIVDVIEKLDPFHFNLLGAFIGKNYNSEIAYFRGIRIPTIKADLKHLGAALAAKGGHAIYHVEGITPEDSYIINSEELGLITDTISVSADELSAIKDELYPYDGEKPDVFVLGCPQFGISEFQRLYILLNGRKISKDKRIIVYTNKAMREMLDPEVLRSVIESGVEVYDDTCMVVTPLHRIGMERVGTDSAKAAHYIPKMSHIPADLMPLEMIVERACK
jgi:predicted aconitase